MKKKWRRSLALLGASAAMALLLRQGTEWTPLRRADQWAQDMVQQQPRAADPRIAMIGITDEALAELGPYDTWTRNMMASALENLAADPDHLPCAVAVDVLYAGESDAEADARLARAAEGLPKVISASLAEFGAVYTKSADGGLAVNPYAVKKLETPYPALREATTPGLINAMYDSDGMLRHAVFYADIPAAGGKMYSMAWEAAQAWAAAHGQTLKAPETDSRGRFHVSYSGGPGAFFDGYSMADLIRGDIPSSWYADKIVLIGPYAAGLRDAYDTPVSRSQQMFGMEFQANVIDAMLNARYRVPISEPVQRGILTVFTFFCAAGFWGGTSRRQGMLSTMLVKLGIAAALILLSLQGAWAMYQRGYILHVLWIPAAVFLCYGTSVVIHAVLAARERLRVTKTFERYVAPTVVREILKQKPEELKLGGETVSIAVLFVDIRGFTTMSEQLPAEAVVRILNRYLSMTSACVERYQGTLDKYVGDATMAFWGAPLPVPDPAFAAARTAMDIIRGADELSRALMEEGGQSLRVGVGIHYGPAVVGNMGSSRRMDYTAIGDTVNTAARLESNAPGGTIYISRAVADQLGDRAAYTSLGDRIRLKGKAEGFEVLTLDRLITDRG